MCSGVVGGSGCDDGVDGVGWEWRDGKGSQIEEGIAITLDPATDIHRSCTSREVIQD